MKRLIMIERLSEIGRNPHRLQSFTNDQLREAMEHEAARLEQQAINKALLEQERQNARRIAEKRRRDKEAAMAIEREQETFRLKRIARPLPPIRTVPVNRLTIGLRDLVWYAKRRFVEAGDQEARAFLNFVGDCRSLTEAAGHGNSGFRTELKS